MTARAKTLGVLGGMGPFATVAFFDLLTRLTPAVKDWDHLRVVIDSHPQIPSRTRHLLYGETSPVAGMREVCRRLEAYPVEAIAIPCNSASYFIPQLAPSIGIPIFNIMDITAAALAERHPRVRRAAALGGLVTYAHRTYEAPLRRVGIEYIHHPEALQRQVEALIERLKANHPPSEIEADFRALLAALMASEPLDALVLGCTEFGLMRGLTAPLPLVDSSEALALHCVAWGQGG